MADNSLKDIIAALVGASRGNSLFSVFCRKGIGFNWRQSNNFNGGWGGFEDLPLQLSS
jgi:hypothetical protein